MRVLRDSLVSLRDFLRAFETDLHRTARATVGLRIVDRIGWTSIARLIVAGFWIISLVQVGTQFRPDLLHPTDIGSDTSNYVAASERLAAGHDIYALAPGDRPAPLDNAPDWTVPTLSPPSAAAANLWAVLLPDGVRLYPTWTIGLAGTVATGLLTVALAPPIFLLIVMQYMPGLAITAWSGNVNALIAPALLVTYWGTRSPSRAAQIAAGAIVAIITAVKLGPALIGVWVLSQRRLPAIVAMVATGLALAVATLVLGGVGSVTEYLDVVRQATANPTSASIPGLVRSAGFGGTVAALALPASLGAIVVGIVALRHRPESLLLAAIGTVFATSVVRYDSIGVVVAAGAVWQGRGLVLRTIEPNAFAARGTDGALPARGVPGRLAVTLPLGIGAAFGAMVVAWSVLTGGLVRSRLTITNRTDQAIVARFRIAAQEASFGFRVPPRATVVGWDDLGAGSPPLVTVWNAGCELLARAELPRNGGDLAVDGAAITIGSGSADGELAPFVSDCTPQFKAETRKTSAPT